ncbi:hypothetical protein [Echinicola salinicaeni]|uniref:hypothetical protein n=1 Tax=Echinicola salinicaeni TaxID=2762757 RepID=UPI00164647F9|nr:hypothetical protein [Echinicola salinicaeni]
MHQLIKISTNLMLLLAGILFFSEEELKPVFTTLPKGEVESKVEVVALKSKAQFRPISKKTRNHSKGNHQLVKNFFIWVKPFTLGKNNFDLSFLSVELEDSIFDLSHVFIGRAPPILS